MKLYKAKIKWYYCYSYIKATVNVPAVDVKDAIEMIHRRYSTNPFRPAFIISIKEVKA